LGYGWQLSTCQGPEKIRINKEYGMGNKKHSRKPTKVIQKFATEQNGQQKPRKIELNLMSNLKQTPKPSRGKPSQERS